MLVRNLRVPGSVVLSLLVALTGCGDGSTGPDAGADSQARVTLSAASSQGVAAGSAAAAATLLMDDQGNNLELTRVALVIREIELEKQFDECDDDALNDDCEKFEAGPLLLEVPLDGSVITIAGVDVPVGVYDELEFEIHKPSNDTPDDLIFLDANADFADVSIRVEGIYNGGEPFVFLQDLNEDQEIDLDPPLAVTEDSPPMNLTLELDVSAWFRDAGGTLIDPETANKGGENENLVENNIKLSIELFEDDDKDGEKDG